MPFLTARLGRRRSWALSIQLLPDSRNPRTRPDRPARDNPAATAFPGRRRSCPASRNIVIDAYRIELLRPEEQGAGAAATQWGYRFGMLASGAGALYAASYGGWNLPMR